MGCGVGDPPNAKTIKKKKKKFIAIIEDVNPFFSFQDLSDMLDLNVLYVNFFLW
jgi:hypothetical protein